MPMGRVHQRRASGSDALVDDVPDDGHRHDLQGAGEGDSGSRRRRPPRRSGVLGTFHGISPTDGRFFFGSASGRSAAAGAPTQSEDGVSATVCINDGDTHNGPSEQVGGEISAAGRARDRCVRTAAAPAAIAAASATRWSMQALDAAGDGHLIDRVHCQPWGLHGGQEAAGNDVALRLGGVWKDDLPNGKALVAAAESG